MNIFRLAAAAVALLCCTALSAQTNYEEAIREDPERAAGVHHSYEYIPAAETPAPRGYTQRGVESQPAVTTGKYGAAKVVSARFARLM